MATSHYTIQQVVELMGREGANDLFANDLAPRVKKSAYVFYEVPYLDQLARMFRIMALVAPPAYDPDFARLYHLGYLYDSLAQRDWESEKKRSKALRSVTVRLDALLAQGRVVTLAYVVGGSARPIAPSAAQKWAAKGSMAAVKIAGVYCLSVAYADRVIWAMNECEVVATAAGRFGIHRGALDKWIQRNRLPAFVGPDGLHRIDPAKLPLAAWAEKGGITAAELARRTGARLGTVQDAVTSGALKASPSWGSRERKIPEDEAAFWVRRFTVLQPGFEWLQGQLQPDCETLSARKAAPILGVAVQTVGRWCKAGRLPYYIRSFGKVEEYALVADYVRGLATFAAPGPVRIDHATAYAAACAKANRIL